MSVPCPSAALHRLHAAVLVSALACSLCSPALTAFPVPPSLPLPVPLHLLQSEVLWWNPLKLKVLTVPGCLMVTGSRSQVVSGFWQVSCKPFFSLITGYVGELEQPSSGIPVRGGRLLF